MASFRHTNSGLSATRSELHTGAGEGNVNTAGLPTDPLRQLLLTRSDQHIVLVVAILLGVLLWDKFEENFMIGWLVAVGVVSLVRYGLSVACEVQRPRNSDLPIWIRRYTLVTAAMGICWGMVGFTPFLSVDYSTLALLYFGLWTIAISAYHAQYAVPRIFLAFMIPALLPATAWMLMQGESLLIGLAAMSIVVSLRMYFGARSTQSTLARAAQLSGNNLELINKLVSAKDESDRVSRELASTNQTLAREVTERERAEAEISASREQLSSILENMQDPLYQVDGEGRITWVSPSIEQLLGYEPKDLIGTPIKGLYVQPEQHDQLLEELATRNGIVEHFETRLQHKCDFEVWISENAHFRYDKQLNPIGVEGSLRDITERKFTQEALFQEREKAHVTLQSIGDGVISTDVTGAVEYINPIAERVTGWNFREARGEAITKVLRLIDEKTDNAMENPVHRALKAGSALKLAGHPRLVHRYGDQHFSVEVTAAPIRDSEGEAIGCVLVFHDVTELRGLAHKMSHQATHDSLTGLINRREFESRIANALERSRREGTEHALCYLDLDQFKIVNDTCGHAAGDELLKQLSANLRAKLRKGDTLARLGGDEFGALLEDCPLEDATRVSEMLRSIVEDFRFAWEDKSFRVGVSIGLAPINVDAGNLSDLLSSADAACYIAKERGRNRVHLLQPDDHALNERRGQMQWLHRIQEALEKGRFQLYFQPIRHVKGKLSGLHGEVLLRMLSERGEIIAPGAFLPSAERYHLMPQIDRWVVSKTFATIQKAGGTESGLDTCCINLSGQSLSDEKFLDYIISEIEKYKMRPQNLCFEITETAVIANLSNATQFISVLRQMGCRFALDDFGSGLSSFAYLKNLAVDYLKLDGSFVKNMVRDNIDRAMVKAINQVGHTMHIQTIAEFVEDEATMKVLSLLGIDFAQGYGVAMPRPFDNVLNLSSLEQDQCETESEKVVGLDN